MTEHSRPFFVYGTLLPGQLGHHKVAHKAQVEDEVRLDDHRLVHRDGLVFAVPCEPGTGTVWGALLWPTDGNGEKLRAAIEKFENSARREGETREQHETRRLYAPVSVTVTSGSLKHKATMYSMNGSRPDAEDLHALRWSIAYDPLFSNAIPEFYGYASELMEPSQSDALTPGFWSSTMIPLEGAYLMLCTILERVALLRSDREQGSSQRIKALDSDAEAFAAVRKVRPPKLEVWSAESADRLLSVYRLSGSGISCPFQAWYQVRNNLSHQGKGGSKQDVRKLRMATAGLFDTLAEFLSSAVPELKLRWSDNGFVPEEHRLSELYRNAQRTRPAEARVGSHREDS